MVDDELHEYLNRELAAMSAFLHGRLTYEPMASVWPTADADPALPAPMRAFAPIWRDMPKLVFSRTLETAGWNSTVVRELDPAAIRAAKQQPGGDMVAGGAVLAAALQEHDLVDEYRLFVHPVVLGRGRPLFPPSDRRIPLRLTGTRGFGTGVVEHSYAVAR